MMDSIILVIMLLNLTNSILNQLITIIIINVNIIIKINLFNSQLMDTPF